MVSRRKTEFCLSSSRLTICPLDQIFIFFHAVSICVPPSSPWSLSISSCWVTEWFQTNKQTNKKSLSNCRYKFLLWLRLCFENLCWSMPHLFPGPTVTLPSKIVVNSCPVFWDGKEENMRKDCVSEVVRRLRLWNIMLPHISLPFS